MSNTEISIIVNKNYFNGFVLDSCMQDNIKSPTSKYRQANSNIKTIKTDIMNTNNVYKSQTPGQFPIVAQQLFNDNASLSATEKERT